MTRGRANATPRSEEGPQMAQEQDRTSVHDIELQLHEPFRLSPRVVLLAGLLLVALAWWLAGGMQAAVVLWAQATIWLTAAIR